ncbi:type I polyketide synthase [Pseudomarimonas arenosa]|uniref:SDR family oxidoreductase n=1 Tax=Pseudomarimonas arenosa TaxID=2774145 RepID=A0AAW3ZL16_9GAMM|nr:type I polyketide synthase [Pseudomarimonas arenosa]MBD8525374.1 SDR family oxidoreductase [Pseudomarimonas arenosa]
MSDFQPPPFAPIAIIGASALFPGSSDAEGFWRDILAGRDLIGDVPPSHWLVDDYFDADPSAPDKTYARRGAFLDPIDFDAFGFGLPPSNIPATDTSQLLALIVAQAVLQDAAGDQFETMDRSRMSVILGVTSAQELLFSMVSRLQRPVWVKALRETGLPEDEVQAACDRIAAQYVPWQESSFPGLLGNVVAGRIANRLNLGGTNCVTDAACASSFSALSMAINELQLGQSDVVITGGVDTLNDIFMFMCFSKTPALSASGDCRPFSAAADGTMLGEGLGMLALKRLKDAERDGDRIYAVIRGVGSSSDGRAKSVYAPVSAGQAQALSRAYQQAGYGPETVELMEAHGTGTKAGDVAEFDGLRMVFDQAAPERKQWCALGSVKSQIGHTKAAAGAAGLFKAVMALHHKVLPPSIKIDAPNPKLGLENSAFYLNTQSRPWIRDAAHPRRASVSAFGFGGSNFHVTVEEYCGAGKPAKRFAPAAPLLFALSADSARDLLKQLRDLRVSQFSVSVLAHRSLQQFSASAEYRLVWLATDAQPLHVRLADALERIEADPAQSWTRADGMSYGVGSMVGDLAFVFPGQGSQYPGMGADLAMRFPAARAVWDRAAAIDFDPTSKLHHLVFPRPSFTGAEREADRQRLTATEWAQPAIGATSLSMLALLRQLGVAAAHMAGHSFGELTALHAAGVYDESSLLGLARRRGELMRDAAAKPGAMLALGLPIERVQALIEEAASDLVVANHNAPQQVIVSGSVESITAFEALLVRQGVEGKRLPVASAFHSPIVAAACAPFAETLAALDFANPSCPTYSNVCAASVSDGTAARQRLAEQIASPVRFVEMIEAMYQAGARCFVEVGPSAVLSGLIAAILGERPHQTIALDRKGRDGVEAFLQGIVRLAALGVPMNLPALFADEREPQVAAARSKHAISISGSNVGKPYPPLDPTTLPAPNPARPTPPPPTNSPSTAEPTAFSHAANSAVSAPSMPSAMPVSDSWIQAFQDSQRQTAEAHAAFQQAMFDSHNAYLRMAETSLNQLGALLGAPAVAGVQSIPAPSLYSSAAVEAQPMVMGGVNALPTPAPAPAVPISVPPATLTAAVLPPVAAPAVDLQALMLSVVADKTGYPIEMLNLEMDLEGDLGIDSIKRVEILSAIDERAPQLPKLDRAHLAGLHTLREIVDYLGRQTTQSATAAAPRNQELPSVDLADVMLNVVADKTGYPLEMLNLDMDLESDLGIDSIKRVEILSAVDERAPNLPKLDRAHLSGLHSLREIVDYLSRQLGASMAPAAVAVTPQAARPAANTVELEAVMLDVVANKTGYPLEMLSLDMDLESDLGIDSIKRVEILSAVDERAPDLPKLDRGHLAGLHTLREIVDYLRGRTEAPTAKAAAPEPTAQRAQTAAAELGRYELRLIDAPPTGLAMPGLLGGNRVWICGGGSQLDQALANALRRQGVNALASDAPPVSASACVFLGGLREFESVDAAIAVNREAFQLARQVGAAHQNLPGLFVTVQDTGGRFGLGPIDQRRAWAAGLPALVKTAALEWPKAALKAIDIERGGREPEALAAALAAELLGGGGEIEVALPVEGPRQTLLSVAATVQGDEYPIEDGDVVLVSGGARGVTAACIRHWSERCKARYVLLGRTALVDEPACCEGVLDEAGLKARLLADAQSRAEHISPLELNQRVRAVLSAREVRATLLAIEGQGAEARYVSVDVDDGSAVQAMLADLRADWGAPKALIHAAGVLADKLIVDKTDEQFDQVFNTKVGGLKVLLDACAEDPLQLLCVFSSVSARCGNSGQADYAMANEVLAKVAAAEAQRRPGLRVKSFGWGPWEGGMVHPALKLKFAELGVPLLPLDVGAKMFVDELADGRPQALELVLGGAPRPESLLSKGASARVQSLELKVHRTSHAYLEGHAVKGRPVVPAVLVAEWLSRAARSFRPGLSLKALHDFKVLKGIRLGGFEDEGDRFIIEASSVNAPGTQLQLLVKDAYGTPYYSARAELGDPAEQPAAPLPEIELQPWDGQPLYQDLLFHRGKFELIETVHGMSDQGGGATVRGVEQAGWDKEAWQLDVAALDGGLQLAVLYGQRMLGGPNLPTAIAEVRNYASAPANGPISATAYRRNVGNAAVTTDIVFNDSQGRRLVELLGVQNHALPRV